MKPITNWVIADLANKEGRALVKAALQQMVRKCVTVTVRNIFQIKRNFQSELNLLFLHIEEATCSLDSLRFLRT